MPSIWPPWLVPRHRTRTARHGIASLPLDVTVAEGRRTSAPEADYVMMRR